MANPKPTVEPAWPPPDHAYDYVLTLNSVELAWEFLRRNKHYQRDYAGRTAAEACPKTLISGHQYWATADIESTADP